MPLYEYSCRACEKDFEMLVSSREADAVRCPTCDGADVSRLFALPARGRVAESVPSGATNCRGDGPPCGAPRCGRMG
jgi:putative FmdB family regulatory protein